MTKNKSDSKELKNKYVTTNIKVNNIGPNRVTKEETLMDGPQGLGVKFYHKKHQMIKRIKSKLQLKN